MRNFKKINKLIKCIIDTYHSDNIMLDNNNHRLARSMTTYMVDLVRLLIGSSAFK